ncbi:MAG: tetratricopeptide repeat protein [Clostridia bacterium]|nr:tetratricopeptide repeat protein [Clostridia bacterium]
METLNPIRPVPQQRIRDRMDAYMSRRDYEGAERHLRYWLEEARAGRDRRGELMVLNELVGHYRKTGNRDGAMACADAALGLVDALDLSGSISEGTTCVNIATAMNAFGENAEALGLFERARAAYEASPAAEPGLLGGLYNNMALTCASLRRWDEAEALYDKATDQMARAPHGALEQAITCLNMANLVEDRDGMEAGESRIYDLLDRASALLDTEDIPHDGYYAFVCEKCAPTFEYYGYFADAERLRQEAARIYEGH